MSFAFNDDLSKATLARTLVYGNMSGSTTIETGDTVRMDIVLTDTIDDISELVTYDSVWCSGHPSGSVGNVAYLVIAGSFAYGDSSVRGIGCYVHNPSSSDVVVPQGGLQAHIVTLA